MGMPRGGKRGGGHQEVPIKDKGGEMCSKTGFMANRGKQRNPVQQRGGREGGGGSMGAGAKRRGTARIAKEANIPFWSILRKEPKLLVPPVSQLENNLTGLGPERPQGKEFSQN